LSKRPPSPPAVTIAPSLVEALRVIPDHRSEVGRLHPLDTILVIAICAMICGADNWVGIEAWAKAKQEWLETFLDLPNGVPSHDTFGRVFSALDPDAFQQAFIAWTAGLSSPLDGDVVAVDGKTLRRSFARASKRAAIHMVSAWSARQGISLGQLKTAEKSNEITAIPRLLNKLQLKGAIVTIDAMGCQKKITATIVDRGADYVIAVKDNQPKLYQGIKDWFDAAVDADPADCALLTATTTERSHGREEVRTVWVGAPPANLPKREEWAGLRSLVCVESVRTLNGKTSVFHRFYISSLKPEAPEKMLRIVREHWAIENSLHWVLDMSFREDDARARVDNAAENLSRLRHFALNLIKMEPSRKVGVKTSRMRAGWDHDYLLKILGVIS